MHSDGRIRSYSIRTITYSQRLAPVGKGCEVMIVYVPNVVIDIQTKNGDHIQIRGIKKKKTIKIVELCINSVVIRSTHAIQ